MTWRRAILSRSWRSLLRVKHFDSAAGSSFLVGMMSVTRLSSVPEMILRRTLPLIRRLSVDRSRAHSFSLMRVISAKYNSLFTLSFCTCRVTRIAT